MKTKICNSCGAPFSEEGDMCIECQNWLEDDLSIWPLDWEECDGQETL